MADAALTRRIVEIHSDNRRVYGRPRIHAELTAEGTRVSGKRVARLMRQQGLRARQRRRFVRTTDSAHSHPVAPNALDRKFEPATPNSTWAGDITYVWMGEGWLYLAVLLDLFSLRVVGWAMSEKIDRELVLSALARS